MKEEGKNFYESPSITIVEVKIERVVCQSPVGAGVEDYDWNEYEVE